LATLFSFYASSVPKDRDQSAAACQPLYGGQAGLPKHNDLAWIHDVVRIKRSFDGTHDGGRRLAMLAAEVPRSSLACSPCGLEYLSARR
jgi:hypothetical protein